MQIDEPFLSGAQPRPSPVAARIVAGIAGSLIVAASAAAIIVAGHQDAPHATLTAALAVGVLTGAAIIGPAWRSRRYALSSVIIGALIAGEAFNLIATADRVVGEREAAAAVVRSQLGAHEYATGELAKTQAAYDAATKAKLTEAAKPGCKAVCAQMLAGTEMAAKADLDVARQRATANPKPEASASALADRLGWAPWVLDLVVAALLSVAANGLGAALVAFATHSGPHSRRQAPATTRPVPVVDLKVVGKPASRGVSGRNPVTAIVSVDTPKMIADTSRTPTGGHPRTPSKIKVSVVSANARTPAADTTRTPPGEVQPDTMAANAVSAWLAALPVASPTTLSLRSLAAEVGSSHQAASRALSSLAARGAVRLEASRVGTTVTRLH